MNASDVLSPNAIIDRIIEVVGVENDNQLADYLDVHRQSIYQFRKGQGGNLTCKLFSAALAIQKK